MVGTCSFTSILSLTLYAVLENISEVSACLTVQAWEFASISCNIFVFVTSSKWVYPYIVDLMVIDITNPTQLMLIEFKVFMLWFTKDLHFTQEDYERALYNLN
jgi:hypothetical protein